MHEQEQKNDKVTFLQRAASLPSPLQRRFLMQSACAVLLLVVTFIIIVVTKEIKYICGVLFSLYLGYLALNLVWDFDAGNIQTVVMVCVKAKRNFRERATLMLRNYDAPALDANAVHKFYVPSAKKELDMISEGTILEVYYSKKNPSELMAWQILGNQTN